MAGYIILNATYGVPASKIYIHTVYNATVGLSLGLSPRGLLHDMFPICEWSYSSALNMLNLDNCSGVVSDETAGVVSFIPIQERS